MDAPERGGLRPRSGSWSMRGRRTGGRCWSSARPARPAEPSPRPCSARGVSRYGPRCARAASPPPPRERYPSPSTWSPGTGWLRRSTARGRPTTSPPTCTPTRSASQRRVADAAAAADLPRLVFHSVLRPDDARMPHHLRKAEAEALLRGGPRRAASPCCAPRPTTRTSSGRPAPGWWPCPTPSTPRSPTSTSTTWRRWPRTRSSAPTPRLTLDLAGPEVLTTRQMSRAGGGRPGPPGERRAGSPLAQWLTGPGRRPDRPRPRGPRRDVRRLRRGWPGRRPAPLAAALGRPPTTWAEKVLDPAQP